MDLSNLSVELLNNYLTGNLTEEEGQLLLQWMYQSKENEQLLHNLKDLYDAGAWKKYFDEAKTDEGWNNLKRYINKKNDEKDQTRRSRFRISARELQKIAAVFILGVISAALISYYFLSPKQVESALTYTVMNTEKGEKSQLLLPDSTKVWLNSASSISYSSEYGSKNRKIELNGEAYFEVRKNTELPFTVEADGFKVRALGTKFSVSSYPSENELYAVLVEGKVSFTRDDDSAQVILKPNQKATYLKSTSEISVSDVSTDFYTSWRYGEIRFRDQTFEEIAKKLERHFNMNIVFQNQKIKKTLYTGTFYNYEKVDIILKIFQKNKYFNYEIKKDSIYIK